MGSPDSSSTTTADESCFLNFIILSFLLLIETLRCHWHCGVKTKSKINLRKFENVWDSGGVQYAPLMRPEEVEKNRCLKSDDTVSLGLCLRWNTGVAGWRCGQGAWWTTQHGWTLRGPQCPWAERPVQLSSRPCRTRPSGHSVLSSNMDKAIWPLCPLK